MRKRIGAIVIGDFYLNLQVFGLPADAWFVLALVVSATLLMAFEVLGPDLILMGALALLVVSGVLAPRDAIEGFASPATVTVGVLFVVARSIQETGVLHQLSRFIFGASRQSRRVLARLLFPTALMSSVLNNTPIVAMLTPMVTGFARRIDKPPSRFLMPLAFATVLGGTCTLVGTSANLVASGVMEQSGLAPMGMFELTAVAAPTALVGIVFLLTAGRALLPDRHDSLAQTRADTKSWLAEVELAADSPLLGRSVEEAGLRHLPGLFLAELRRGDEVIAPVAPHDRLRASDHLVFTGRVDTIRDLTSMPGITATGVAPDPAAELFEVVISHNGGLVGVTAKQVAFRRRYDAAILAVHRAGERIEGKIGEIVLHAGDTLLLSASPGFARTWYESDDFYLVSEVQSEGQPRYRKAPIALAVLVMMVVLPSATEFTMLHSSLAALVLMLATGCVSSRGARDAVDGSVLIVIGSGFGLSRAIVDTGLALEIGKLLIGVSEPFGPYALLAASYALAATLSSFVSNAAAAALIVPIGIAAAQHAGLDPRPFALAMTIASSAAFASPVADQTSLIVYGAGGYRFVDFVRVGLPLTILCGIVVVALTPWVWPLVPM